MTNNKSLTERAMIMSLKISQWTGRRLDRKITDEVNQNHNAADDAGRYNKLLLPKEAMAGVVSAIGETRTGFIKRTLPWLDNGSRIMAAEKYHDHAAWFNEQKANFNKEVEDFLREYPFHVQQAQSRLGSMFEPDDYPAVEEIRRRFGMSAQILPVPDASDFRADISEHQREAIRANIEETINRATSEAIKDIYARVAESVGRMVERLNAYKPSTGKGDRATGTFKDSLVGNVRELIELMPALNITGDPALAQMALDLQPLVQYEAKTLREDEGKRADIAEEAARVLESINDFIA